MTDWVEMTADPSEVRRERAKARELRATEWWRNKLSKGVCHYCGRNVGADNLTLDHVIPVARGGKSVKSNCVPCCKDCNNKKKAKTPAEMILEKLFGNGGDNEYNNNV